MVQNETREGPVHLQNKPNIVHKVVDCCISAIQTESSRSIAVLVGFELILRAQLDLTIRPAVRTESQMSTGVDFGNHIGDLVLNRGKL